MGKLQTLIGLSAAATAAIAAKVRVISDIHAGSCWMGDPTQLFSFLEQTAKENVDILVLNGDVYDFWLLPLDKPQPSLHHSIAHGINTSMPFDMTKFHTLLRRAARSVVTLHETNGNHDMWLDAELANSMSHGPSGDVNITWQGDGVTSWGVRFEHGHKDSLFEINPPGTNKMPIGYYITRTVATYACNAESRVSHFEEGVVKDFIGTRGINDATLEILREPKVFKKVLKTILHTSSGGKLPKDLASVPITGVRSPDKIPAGDDTYSNYTLDHFVNDYQHALTKTIDQVGMQKAAKMLIGDIITSQLDILAGKSSIDESLVVLGHTHVPNLQIVERDHPSRSPTPDALVLNAGAWVPGDDGKPLSNYADITIEDIVEDYSECYTKKDGSDYRGTVSHTEDGKACLHWGADTPRRTSYQKAFGRTAFCRNMGDAEQPWCWTGATHWGTCKVGPPRKTCSQELKKGAVKVDLFSYPNPQPIKSASRKGSTSSRWTMAQKVSMEEVAVMV